jgi:deazaflavin-dependent oxidoreductase (nitroreductase family)
MTDGNAWEESLIADMRAHGGAVTSGPLAGDSLLIMTATGARSGMPRRAILNFSRDGAAYVVAGTAAGSTVDPSWLANIAANPTVDVEAEGRSFRATATISKDADRDQLWDRHVEATPRFAVYPEQTGRVIPMVRITPIAAD